MSIENNSSQNISGDSPANSGIITPDQARQEGYRQDQQITVNSAGDTKEAGSDTVTTSTGETYTPTSNQNDVDIDKYQAVEHEVKTDSVVTPSGKRIYRQEVDSKNTGAVHDLESDQWMETKHSKEAPETDSFLSAQRVSNETINTRSQATQDLEEGGAKWRNNRGQFSKKGDGRLDATKEQIEQARSEMNVDQRDQHAEALDSNREANKGFHGVIPPSKGMSEALRGIDETSRRVREQEERARKHQEALDSNKKANEGFIPNKPTPSQATEALGHMNERSKSIREQAEKDRKHQEALDSNRKANEGFNGAIPPSKGVSEALRGMDETSRRVREQEERARKHQEALDSNRKANEGFNSATPPLKGMTEALRGMDETARGVRGQEEGGDSENTLPQQTSENPLTEIRERLGRIDGRLDGIQEQLDGINSRLIEAQSQGELNTEEILTMMMEQNRLFTEQSQLQTERFEALLQQQMIQQNVLFQSLLDRLGETTPEETTPEETEPEVIPPTAASDSDRITQLENELRNWRGEDTPEQRSLLLSQELAQLEDLEMQRGLTDQEKIRYFDLQRQKEIIDKQLNQEQQESRRKRERKEKIIKWVAGAAGGAIALASPPVGIAAVIGVTLGGRFIGKGLKKWSENLRSKANAMKYEGRRGKSAVELNELDRRIRRREWWSDRLGEVSATVLGGSTGYGLGKAIQNIFGWKGISGSNTAEAPQGNTGVDNTTQPPTSGDGAVGPEDTFELPQNPDPIGGGGAEQAEWFNASDYGWDAQQLGWMGDRVALGAHGSSEGVLQKEFFEKLFDLVPNERLMGQAAGNTANQFLRQAYNGVDPTLAAQNAAQAILGQ